jgi:hypothetical protein
MKAIPVPSLHIYEFECDLGLIDHAVKDFQSQNIEWGLGNSIESNSKTMYGWLDLKNQIPWYHEELFNWIQDCLNQVSEVTVKWPLTICDSWTTKTEYKQKDTDHNHAFSVFSGVLYFSDHTSSTTLFSYVDYTRERFSNICPVTSPTGTMSFIPQKGKMLIFPSNMYHHIQTHNELKNIRHSLSFNTFFSGLISPTPTSFLNTKLSVKDRYTKWQENKELK